VIHKFLHPVPQASKGQGVDVTRGIVQLCTRVDWGLHALHLSRLMRNIWGLKA
jgi:hypothetical protein